MRNKGKVHPSPSSSSSSNEALSVLTLLPAAILALTWILSVEEREVLAYMLTRSMKTSTSSSMEEKRTKRNSRVNPTAHKPPLFDCDCFDCYTNFWFRWDSSPNRELIHQAIEAFEEHLNTGERSAKNGRSRRKEKTGRRGMENAPPSSVVGSVAVGTGSSPPSAPPETARVEESNLLALPRPFLEIQAPPPPMPESNESTAPEAGEWETVEAVEDVAVSGAALAARGAAASNHKGFARKVLPDVLGVFNSRLWSLWSPNL